MNIFTWFLAPCLLTVVSGIRGPRLPTDFASASGSLPPLSGSNGPKTDEKALNGIDFTQKSPNTAGSDGLDKSPFAKMAPVTASAKKGNGGPSTMGDAVFSNATVAEDGRGNVTFQNVPWFNVTSLSANEIDVTVNGTTSSEDFTPSVNTTSFTENATKGANGTVNGNATIVANSSTTSSINVTTLPPYAPSSTNGSTAKWTKGQDDGANKNGTSTFNATSDGPDHPTWNETWTGLKTDNAGERNVTGATNGTSGSNETIAGFIGKPKDFDEKKFVKTNADDFSDVPIPNPCQRGFRQVKGQCEESKFRRDSANNIIYPVCDEDFHCPSNAICDQSQELCQCVHGQPLDERSCEGSSLGGRCDESVNCKSWDHTCINGTCDCLPGHHREENQCTRFLDLDNDCTPDGIPCFGEHVGCLDSRGRECPINATCACRCQLGYEKNPEKKICFKPVPPTRRTDRKVTTTTTRPPVTTTTIKARGRASKISFNSFYIVFGWAILRWRYDF